MNGVVLASGAAQSTICRASVRTTQRCSSAIVRPFTSSKLAPAVPRNVTANFFKFGKSRAEVAREADLAELDAQQRHDFTDKDVEDYFSYMGFLASEGSYDRLHQLLASGIPCIDIILLLACSEDDIPKVEEVLKAGAHPDVKGIDGKTPMELAKKPEVIKMLKDALASR